MNRARDPGMRRCPMANPAIVAKTTEIGTTPSTMRTLEVRSASMCASSKACRKLPHCGSSGHDRPGGTVREGCRAVVNRLTNGTIVTTISTMSRSRPVQTSVRPTITPCSSRVSRWMGRTAMSTRTMSTTASADARPTWRP